jgi:hypothetical protein
MPGASIAALLLATATALVVLAATNWRWRLGALGLQYVAVFFLVSQSWPASLAVVKLLAGFMAASVLAVSRAGSRADVEMRRWPAEWVFRLLAAVLAFMAAASLVPRVLEAIPEMPAAQAWAGLVLVGLGLLNLGFSTRTLPVLASLLMFMAGFEVMYAAVEQSTLVAGLLALVNLGIALAGSYLLEVEQPGAA